MGYVKAALGKRERGGVRLSVREERGARGREGERNGFARVFGLGVIWWRVRERLFGLVKGGGKRVCFSKGRRRERDGKERSAG